jgi:hypothetical protein
MMKRDEAKRIATDTEPHAMVTLYLAESILMRCNCWKLVGLIRAKMWAIRNAETKAE